ncbi:hypothetical protein A7P55_19090 [Acinetobacter sp. Ac_5812]|nr:hypothetical protein [Acinetobacter sp. Ac_5812]
MEDYNYWITVYAAVFTILIASLSVNSLFFIKDKVNKILFFFVFSGLYSFILTYIFQKAYIDYTQQELLSKFIYTGYKKNFFYGSIYSIFSIAILIIIILRNFLTKNTTLNFKKRNR